MSRRRLIIGSLNTVGQATGWARSVRQFVSVDAESWCSFRVAESRLYGFPADRTLRQEELSGALAIAKTHLVAARRASHVMMESGRTLAGMGAGNYTMTAGIALRALGCVPSIVFHGSELRSPVHNLGTRAESPFHQMDPEMCNRLERQSQKTKRLIARWPFNVFVSTPDLVPQAPGSTWLPVVPDLEWFEPILSIDPRTVRPKVLHLPSSRELSNSAQIEAVCTRLSDAGLIEFRSVTGLDPSSVRQQIAWSDIVIDKIGIGVYGVMAVQTMASGRLLIGDVDDATRAALPDLPLIQTSIATLEATIRGLVGDRSSWAARAAAGEAFARRYHDGRYSAAVLAKWMGVPVNQP